MNLRREEKENSIKKRFNKQRGENTKENIIISEAPRDEDFLESYLLSYREKQL